MCWKSATPKASGRRGIEERGDGWGDAVMVKIIVGDCRSVLPTLESESVNCVVTSPPYWGLRDYGTAAWEGGDPGCDHKQGRNGAGRADGIVDERGQRNRDGVGAMGGDCRKCGARRIDAQMGLERTPEEYVSALVTVFREVRRVLREDGTLWLNMGDSFYGGKGSNGSSKARRTASERVWAQSAGTVQMDTRPLDLPQDGLKPKDLVGIPWRVAFALQADGWWLRSDIIWAKNNPMPESVTDRPTKSHEYIFLLAKSERYYYDAAAIMEPWESAGTGVLSVGSRALQGTTYGQSGRSNTVRRDPNIGRNKRDVWTVPTAPYSGAHFATFPPALIKPCILAGCPPCGTVLDPFAGSGTTGEIAAGLGRNAVLIELNPEYAKLARDRCGLFCGSTAHALPDETKTA
jgi:DNA modification methylase